MVESGELERGRAAVWRIKIVAWNGKEKFKATTGSEESTQDRIAQESL